MARVLQRYAKLDSDLARHLYITSVQGPTLIFSTFILMTSVDRNETLFYHIICSDVRQNSKNVALFAKPAFQFKKFAPIIYTPTIGEICQDFR
jgi:hypothetical protein